MGSVVTFEHPTSSLVLYNTAAANRTFALGRSLTVDGDGINGIIQTESTGAHYVTVTSPDKTIGSAGHRIQALITNDTRIEVPVFAKEIEVSGNTTFTRPVNSGGDGEINLVGNVQFQDDVTAKDIFYRDTNATLQIKKDNATVKANIPVPMEAHNNTFEVLGQNVTLDGTIVLDGVFKVTSNADGTAGGDVTITAGKTLYANDIILDGAQANKLVLGERVKVKATNNIKIGNTDGKIILNKDVTITGKIDGDDDGRGIMEFNGPATVTGDIGSIKSLKELSVKGGGTVRITGSNMLKVSNISFTSAGPATLIVDKGLGIVFGDQKITTNGNFIHTLALGQSSSLFMPVGGEGLGLNIILFNNAGIRIFNYDFFAKVFTNSNETGSVVFLENNGISYDLGDFTNALLKVQFTKNTEVRGSVYAKDIEIDNGKTVRFNGTRNIDFDLGGYVEEASGKTINLSTIVSGTEFKLGGKAGDDHGKAIFKGGTILDMPIVASAANEGQVQFLGDTLISRDIGSDDKPVNLVEFAPDSKAYLYGNIFSVKGGDGTESIKVSGTTLELIKSVNIEGHIGGTDTSLILSKNRLDYTGKAKLDGAVTLITGATNAELGFINIHGAETELDLSGATSVNITFSPNTTDRASVIGQTLYLITADDNAEIKAPGVGSSVTITPDVNRGIKWTYNPGTFSFTAEDNMLEVIEDALPSPVNRSEEESEIVEAILDNNATGDILDLQNDLGKMNGEQVREAIDDLIPISTTQQTQEITQEAIDTAIHSTVASISNRVSSLILPVAIVDTIGIAPPITTVPAQGLSASPANVSIPATSPAGTGTGTNSTLPGGNSTPSSSGGNIPSDTLKENNNVNKDAQKLSELYGVAAGDDIMRFGAWGMPLYNRITQKQRSGIAGYKAEAYGMLLGLDSMVSDDLILGIAASYIDLNVKHRDYKKGDKTNSKTYLLSLYGLQQLPNNFFMQAVATFTNSDVTNSETRRVTETSYQTAYAKYSSSSYGLEALVGYNRLRGSIILTPMAGIRYRRYVDGSYTETGIQRKLTVFRKAYDKVESVLGGRINTAKEVGGVIIIPELHGFFSYDLTGKHAKINAYMDGRSASLVSPEVKTPRASFNVGSSVTAKYNLIEYGIGYDLQLASKMVSHQASLKIRVNF